MNWLGDAPSSSDIDPKELKRDVRRAIPAIIRSMNNKLRFETVEELLVVKENVAIARKRSLIGFLTVGATSGLAWRYAFGKRGTPFAAASGALAGMTYGMFSVREKFFLDLLSLPDEVSPFAREAHKMQVARLYAVLFDTAMPNSVIHREIRARRREKFPSFVEVGIIWMEPPPPPSSDGEKPKDFFGGDEDGDASASPSPQQGRVSSKQNGPGGKDDPWGTSGSNDGPWGFGTASGDEWGEFGEKEHPPKPTTWDEIRRRSGTS